ncbi:MAG TPA: phage holin family protein [Planctomycetaceae bacterium]|nr:phage holin family protein [Planctomycetaceae bacterium]
MSVEPENRLVIARGPSLASLLSGILGDLQKLVEQQFQLTRCELEQEFRQRASAAAVFGMGLATIFLAAFMLSLSAAHLLHWLMTSGTADTARLPLWACEAMICGAQTVAGSLLVWKGRRQFQVISACQNPASEIFQD